MKDPLRKNWIKGGHVSSNSGYTRSNGSSVERRLERLEEQGKLEIKIKTK